jgi:hypothetical protein
MKPDFDLDYIVYMKYGVHTSEELGSIVARKIKEIDDTGVMFWGYGGTLCHPIKQIAPFAEMARKNKKDIYLVMSRTPSNHYGESSMSKYYSVDGVNFSNMPKGISVLGSRYALVCDSLIECDFSLNLAGYEIAIGSKQGNNLGEFIRNRVDKGCAVRRKTNDIVQDKFVNITLAGKLRSPFAALIKY